MKKHLIDFATPTACNVPKQAPRFEDGKWYISVNCNNLPMRKVSGSDYLYEPVENVLIAITHVIGQLSWTPCNPDGSPLQPEPKVGDVWTDGTREYTLTELRTDKTRPKFAMWLEREFFYRNGFCDTPAEAVEGLQFVRRAGE